MNKPGKPPGDDPGGTKGFKILCLVGIYLYLLGVIGHHFYPGRIRIPAQMLTTALLLAAALVGIVVPEYVFLKWLPKRRADALARQAGPQSRAVKQPEKPRREDWFITYQKIMGLLWIFLSVSVVIGHHFHPARIHVPSWLLPMTLFIVGILVLTLISEYLREKRGPPKDGSE